MLRSARQTQPLSRFARIASAGATLLFLALGSCGTSVHAATQAAGRLPNIILLFADDLGYGDIQPFGSPRWKTPHLNAMADSGMRFTSFYATPVCSMSRACLMTGCYSARVSMPGVLFPNSRIGLHPDELTIAEVLKQKGYETACVGKWHLGHLDPFLPTRQGFDSYFGIPYSNDMALDPEHANFAADCNFRNGLTAETARAHVKRHDVPLLRGTEIIEYPADQSTLTQRYTAEAIKFLRDHHDRPFFLYLPHAMVHAPLAASREFEGRSGGGLLGDAVEELDWSVGQILKTIDELQLNENTLVVFTSDNGAAAGSSAPWRGKKGTNFEGGVREPCLMRWTGKIPAGTTCPQIAGNIDLLPTFASLAVVALPEHVTRDGRDLSPLLVDPHAGPVRSTHLYFMANQSLAGIREGEWKLLIRAPTQPAARGKAAANLPILYNLLKDPTESTDVAVDHPEIVARLQDEARRREQEINANQRPIGRAD